MGAEFAKIVRDAIRSWPKTLRLCLILVVAAMTTIYFYLMGVPVLPALPDFVR